MRMEITTIQFTDDMLKDILKLDFAPGGNEPVWQNMQKGVYILDYLPKLATQVATNRRRDDDCGGSYLRRSREERKRSATNAGRQL